MLLTVRAIGSLCRILCVDVEFSQHHCLHVDKNTRVYRGVMHSKRGGTHLLRGQQSVPGSGGCDTSWSTSPSEEKANVQKN